MEESTTAIPSTGKKGIGKIKKSTLSVNEVAVVLIGNAAATEKGLKSIHDAIYKVRSTDIE